MATEHDRWFRTEVERTVAGIADGSVRLVDEAEWRMVAAAIRSALEPKASGDRQSPDGRRRSPRGAAP